MDLGFESLRDRHLIMKEINYRLFSSKDKQSVLELWKTCNLTEFQKKGVGSKILNVVEKKLLKIGCPKINLFVRNTNVQVKSFYKKNQYTFQESEIYGKRLILDN